ncbi:hypothetical protein LINPERPRIM_LOCUS13774 [Linum perenne]
MGSEDSRHNCNMIKALLVDDDTIAKLLHPKLLEKVGILYHKIASDGQEAVDLVASLGVEYFDVILMDIGDERATRHGGTKHDRGAIVASTNGGNGYGNNGEWNLG